MKWSLNAKSHRSLNETVEQRFERYTIPEPNSGCLLWFGTTDRHGYGYLRVNHRNKFASHIALEIAGRPVPKGKCALHSCDNPPCVNADHLFVDVQTANVDDMIRKGRENWSGLRSVSLDPIIKCHALRLYEEGRNATEISALTGVSGTTAHEWMKQWGYKPRNLKERTHCPQGHPYSGDNLYISRKGNRFCRACHRASGWRRRERLGAWS